MSDWNLSSDQVTLEQRERRSPGRWLHQNSLRIAVILGLVEAAVAWSRGISSFAMLLLGVLVVLVYLNVRTRLPSRLRRPLWVVAVAQGVAGILVPAIVTSIFIGAVIGTLLLLIMLLVLLGDRRRQ
ncbi:MAG: hypothetical protein ACXVYV_00595 [Gaiellales bacterium]